METIASKRKKARDIESSILSGIAQVGQSRVADAIGIHESQVSRWKSSMIPKAALLLHAIGYEVSPVERQEIITFSGNQAADLAKMLQNMLGEITEKPAQSELNGQVHKTKTITAY